MGLLLIVGESSVWEDEAFRLLRESAKYEPLHLQSLSEAFSVIQKNGADLLLADVSTAHFATVREEGVPYPLENVDGRFSLHMVRRYIRTHYAEKLSLARLAKEAGISKNYLSSLFRKEYGISVVDYMQKVRMERAAYLLLSGELSVQKIAKSVGFRHCSYFCKCFFKYFGQRPTAYRNDHSTAMS